MTTILGVGLVITLSIVLFAQEQKICTNEWRRTLAKISNSYHPIAPSFQALEAERRSREAIRAAAERSIRVGTLTVSDEKPGWMTYRYQHRGNGFEISFPSDWSLMEFQGANADQPLSSIDISPSSGFNRISVYLAETEYGGFGPLYYLDQIPAKYAPVDMPTYLGEEDVTLFKDVPVDYVDGGIPILGEAIYFPLRSVFLSAGERSSYEPDNRNPDLIDATTTQVVLTTFKFLGSVRR